MEQVRKEIKKKKRTFSWSITYLSKWKLFRRQFLLSLRRLFVSLFFLVYQHFCLLRHLEIMRCIMKSLIATSTYFLLKYNRKQNLKSVVCAPDFGRPNRYTGLPNGLDTSLPTHTDIEFQIFFVSLKTKRAHAFCWTKTLIKKKRNGK